MSPFASRSLLLVAAVLTVAVGLFWWPAGTATADPSTSRLPVVRVESTREAPETREHVFFAATRPAAQARVAFAQPGRMLERSVDVGDLVVQEQTLAQLDLEPYRLQVAAASARIDEVDAQAEQLDRERDRAVQLIAADFGTAQQLEQLDAQARALAAGRAAADAQRREASRRQRDATLRAPWAGVVAEVYAEPGEVVGAGQPVLLLADPDAVEIEVDVPESVFATLAVDMPVRVDLPLSGREDIPGMIIRRGDVAPGVGRLFPVVVRLDDDAVVAGMAAEVYVDVPAPAGIWVPMGAVVDPSGASPRVLAVTDDRILTIPVDVLGIVDDGAVVFGEGLTPGVELVVAGHVGLANDVRVEARR